MSLDFSVFKRVLARIKKTKPRPTLTTSAWFSLLPQAIRQAAFANLRHPSHCHKEPNKSTNLQWAINDAFFWSCSQYAPSLWVDLFNAVELIGQNRELESEQNQTTIKSIEKYQILLRKELHL